MTSKKPPRSKRSALPRTSDYTKTFLKDWERLTRSGRFDMNRLKEVMLLLIAKDGPLGPEWADHRAQTRHTGGQAMSGSCQPCKLRLNGEPRATVSDCLFHQNHHHSELGRPL